MSQRRVHRRIRIRATHQAQEGPAAAHPPRL